MAGKGNINRWLYRGKRPHTIAKFFNWLWGGVGSWGVLPDLMVRLEVVGRKSGKIVSLPVVIAKVEGQRYLVSMLGDSVQWVQNVRAAGGKAVIKQGKREEVRLEEVSASQRAPIIKNYLQRAPGARPHIPLDKDAPLAEFEKIAANYPAFRIVLVKTAK